MADEIITSKEQWYDLAPYKQEIAKFVSGKKVDLSVTGEMDRTADALRRVVYSGSTEAIEQRYAHTKEMFKVYKAALIESNLQGYSALLEATGDDAYSTLKAPELKKVMTKQFQSINLLERLTNEALDDWMIKGETCAIWKLKEDKEEYRYKEELIDLTTGEKVGTFKIKQISNSSNVDIELIDPLDVYIDAYDYAKDPRGCVKIIRTYISPKTLLSSDVYKNVPLEDKKTIIAKSKGKTGIFRWLPMDFDNYTPSEENNIEVLTFFGDYITNDCKILRNIKAVVLNGITVQLKYSDVNSCRFIYAAYAVDRVTHRGISPLAGTICVDKMANSATDLFLTNTDFINNPIALVPKGTFTRSQMQAARKDRWLEWNDIGQKPDFWSPQPINPQGLALVQSVIDQSKNVLGVNNYMAGDTSGAVRTARESSILTQKANARMRVETDVFSYKFMLPLFISFYAINRELALLVGKPMADIYSDERLRITISTNASKADNEGELNRLMQMLDLPIAQMIFSNLQPAQVILAVRYLMSKAGLTDADNLLELVDSEGRPNNPPLQLSDGLGGNDNTDVQNNQ